ncbi:MAG: hypothetical protein GVY15_09650 [Bacteroidetes bacterium]|nr:hypothetical protein [Bacteroidota bacterium]
MQVRDRPLEGFPLSLLQRLPIAPIIVNTILLARAAMCMAFSRRPSSLQRLGLRRGAPLMTFTGEHFDVPFLETYTPAMPSLIFAPTCETPILLNHVPHADLYALPEVERLTGEIASGAVAAGQLPR